MDLPENLTEHLDGDIQYEQQSKSKNGINESELDTDEEDAGGIKSPEQIVLDYL